MSGSASVEATRPPSFSLKHAVVVLVHVEKLHVNPSLFRIMQSSHPPPKDLLCVEIVQYDDAMLKGFVTKATNNRRMVRLAREV